MNDAPPIIVVSLPARRIESAKSKAQRTFAEWEKATKKGTR